MPELPEVETVRRGLIPIVGSQITGVSVFRDRSVRHQVDGAAGFIAALDGAILNEVVRRGKFLWFPYYQPDPGTVNSQKALVAHLGMSGQLLIAQGNETHLRVRLNLQLPNGQTKPLDFYDQRTFGYLVCSDLVPTNDGLPGGIGTEAGLVPTRVAHIGRDVLDPSFSPPSAAEALQEKRSEIKRLLLDQTIVAGIGNIYADEALWRARVHPLTKANTLSLWQIESILSAAAEVINEALGAGGTSFDRLYVNVNGESGSFSDSLAVYGQTGKLCPRCADIIERISFMNRSSHFCGTCQSL
jgi:formamidopyrimidine-DNA glycosylase